MFECLNNISTLYNYWSLSEKEEQRERPLSVKAAIIIITVPFVLYFLVKAFKIDPAYIVFGLLGVFFVIIPLVIAVILSLSLIPMFSAWLEGKAPTDKHKSKCRVCGKEFEPPLGNRLLEAHVRSVHRDFVMAEKRVRGLLSVFLAISFLEVSFWFFSLVYPFKFTLIGMLLDVLKNFLGFPRGFSLLFADLLLFMVTMVVGLYYYRIVRKYRGLYSQHPPEGREKAYGALRTLPGLSRQGGQETGREPEKSKIPLSELDELIRKAYAPEAEEKPEEKEQA